MTLQELLDQINASLEKGLPPDTTVVIATVSSGWYDILDGVRSPVSPEDGCDLWFTLFPGEEADARFTPGGMPDNSNH